MAVPPLPPPEIILNILKSKDRVRLFAELTDDWVFRTPAKEPLPGDPPVNSSSLEKSLLAGYPGVPTVLDDSQVTIFFQIQL